MKLEGITDIFFDLDHTIWDFDKNSALAFEKIFKLNQVDVALEDFLIHYKEINFRYWKLYRDEKIDKDLLRFGRLNDTFLALRCVVDKDLIMKLSADYITYLTDHNYLIDNAIVVLDYLSASYNLHILSNGFEEVQYRKLTKSNIHHYFKSITNGETVGIKKPNPEIFNYALKMANTHVKNSIMVGDGYEADILGAMGIGMEAIYFRNNDKAIYGDVKQITNLIELKKYL